MISLDTLSKLQGKLKGRVKKHYVPRWGSIFEDAELLREKFGGTYDETGHNVQQYYMSIRLGGKEKHYYVVVDLYCGSWDGHCWEYANERSLLPRNPKPQYPDRPGSDTTRHRIALYAAGRADIQTDKALSDAWFEIAAARSSPPS